MKDENVVVVYNNDEFTKETLENAKICINKLHKEFLVEGYIFKNNINIYLAPNRNEFEYLILNILKINIKMPTSKGRIAQPQKTDLILLCPSAYETDSIYKYNSEEYKRLLMHEMVHMFHEHLSADMEHIARWFSEGIAVYLSKQYKYEDEFNRSVMDGVSNNKIPKISDIIDDVMLSYDWGWTLVKYINDTYGFNMILNIMRNCGSSDIIGFMKEDKVEFEEKWREWLLNKNVSVLIVQ